MQEEELTKKKWGKNKDEKKSSKNETRFAWHIYRFVCVAYAREWVWTKKSIWNWNTQL